MLAVDLNATAGLHKITPFVGDTTCTRWPWIWFKTFHSSYKCYILVFCSLCKSSFLFSPMIVTADMYFWLIYLFIYLTTNLAWHFIVHVTWCFHAQQDLQQWFTNFGFFYLAVLRILQGYHRYFYILTRFYEFLYNYRFVLCLNQLELTVSWGFGETENPRWPLCRSDKAIQRT